MHPQASENSPAKGSGDSEEANTPAIGRRESADGNLSDTTLGSSIELQPFTAKRAKTWLRFYPALPLVYVGHIWFRRRMPRVLPRFTSLRLWELYSAAGVYSALAMKTKREQTYWAEDRDLAIIQIAAYLTWSQCHEDLKRIQQISFPPALSFLSRSIYYPRREDGVMAELVWWYNHMWSPEQTWKVLWVDLQVCAEEMQQQHGWEPPCHEDWDVGVTFLANAIHGEKGAANANYAWPVAKVFTLMTPIAMLARWAGLRALFVPMNILQRGLFYGMAYLYPMHAYQIYSYSTTFRDKHKFAELMCEMCPGLGDLTDKVIRDHGQEALDTLM